MISLVVEKGFLLWLQSSSINSAIRQDYFDFLEGLNSNLEIYIDFKQDSIDPIESSFIKLISNYNNPIVKQFKSIEEILEKDCTDKMPIYSMFFLTNESAKKVGELVNRGIEVFGPSNFESGWKNHLTTKKLRTDVLPVTKSGFNSWAKLNEFRHPVSTLIICDPYILADIDLIESNLLQIITTCTLLSPIPCEKEIIIVSTDANSKNDNNEYWNKVFGRIRKMEESRSDLKIFLFRYPKNLEKHARGVFTPYWFIKSGNSFNYFDKKSGYCRDYHPNLHRIENGVEVALS